MSHDEFLRNQRELFYDRKFDASLAAVAEAMQEEAAGLGGLGEEGLDDLGDLGGEDAGGGDLGGDELGGDELGGDALGGDDLGGDEDVLLATPGEAAPGRRDDGSKGKVYYPVKQGRDRRPQGAVKRHRKSIANGYVDPRSVFPGKKGHGGLDSLAKGMFENQESNYTEEFISEEEKILDMNWEVKNLIESLGKISESKNEA